MSASVAIVLSSLAFSTSIDHGLFGCYQLSKPIKEMMRQFLYKMKWHKWRGSHRFKLLQELLNGDDELEDKRKEHIQSLKEVLQSTILSCCQLKDLTILCDTLDDMPELELFSISLIVTLARTIDLNKDNIVCWQVIGEMLKKMRSNGNKGKSLLKSLLAKYKILIETNYRNIEVLSIIMELLYENYFRCPCVLDEISTYYKTHVRIFK